MEQKSTKKILIIVGSADENASNHIIAQYIQKMCADNLSVSIIDSLASLPHFNPRKTINETPDIVVGFRDKIAIADFIIFITPEYIFSIPAGLKNALEWCVATTIFTDKPVAIITASADGKKGHEQLQLIMKTLGATFSDDSCLLIQGIKGKVADGILIDSVTKDNITNLTEKVIEHVTTYYS